MIGNVKNETKKAKFKSRKEFEGSVLKQLHNNEKLLNIRKDGVIIMDEFAIKLENLKKAFQRLQEAIEEFCISTAIQGGSMQAYEISLIDNSEGCSIVFELLKSLKSIMNISFENMVTKIIKDESR